MTCGASRSAGARFGFVAAASNSGALHQIAQSGLGRGSLYVVAAGFAALVDPAARTSERLTRPNTFLDGYAWSPDGRYITYGELVSGGTITADRGSPASGPVSR